MQGKHQDGHLITVWNSQDPGMEYFVGNDRETTEPLTLATTQVLLMPGDLLTRITGGDIRPMFHQVRRIESVHTRLAIMYFSNPDPGKPVYPCSPRTERVDLSRLIREERLLIRTGAPDVTANVTTRTVPAGTPAEAET
jgi:isopenicillin N synthase-like dioxygenase